MRIHNSQHISINRVVRKLVMGDLSQFIVFFIYSFSNIVQYFIVFYSIPSYLPIQPIVPNLVE